MSRGWLLVVLYGIANAGAYSCLLPLWEGFDEAYHYGYVQLLTATHEFPVLGRATLSREIWHAFEIVPVSHWIQPYTKAPMNFGEYFALPRRERDTRLEQLESLGSSEKYERQPDKPNYEVNQSPLPYLLMAPVDAALHSWALRDRILALRLIISIATIVLIAHSTWLLAARLQVPDTYVSAALFCVFSSQMLYATICHVCNDWLAVPLMTYLLWAALRVHQGGTRRDCLWLGLALSAALLTKAYFLFVIPFAFGVMLLAFWRGRTPRTRPWDFLIPLVVFAGPWYLRNLVLYHNLGGTPEQTAGLGLQSFLSSALSLPWRRSIIEMAHSSLWTGNNSFTTFSANTLNLLLLLLAVSLSFIVFARPRASEGIVAAGILTFCLGLAFAAVTFFISSKGAIISAFPWYMQVLLPPVLLLAFLGLSRALWAGRIVAAGSACIWSYVLIATYLAKLAPMYGGYPDSRSHLGTLWAWYWSRSGDWSASLGDPLAVWSLIGASAVLSTILCLRLVDRSLRGNLVNVSREQQGDGRRSPIP